MTYLRYAAFGASGLVTVASVTADSDYFHRHGYQQGFGGDIFQGQVKLCGSMGEGREKVP